VPPTYLKTSYCNVAQGYTTWVKLADNPLKKSRYLFKWIGLLLKTSGKGNAYNIIRVQILSETRNLIALGYHGY
jgi:hypothetical protein